MFLLLNKPTIGVFSMTNIINAMMNGTDVELKIVNSAIGTEFPLPKYESDGAAGLDIRAFFDNDKEVVESVTIQPNCQIMVGAGIAININNPNLAATLLPRSGLGSKHGIVLGNLVGLIDSDFQGELGICLWNRGKEPFTIKRGERVCQMVFLPVVKATFNVVNEFSEKSERGENGFGSSGTD